MDSRLGNFSVKPPPLPLRYLEKENLKNKQWIQTFTGKKIEPLRADPSQVNIEDIAHALAYKCRYTGHCEPFYSVAEHSVRVAGLLPPDLKLAGLLHDAAEAYLPDVAAPIKSLIYLETPTGTRTFSYVEKEVLHAIGEGLDLVHNINLCEVEQVKYADLTMLATEVRDLMAPPPSTWGLLLLPDPTIIEAWSAKEAEIEFLHLFHTLVGA